jgi:two-component system chemotaxis response regulator CheY
LSEIGGWGRDLAVEARSDVGAVVAVRLLIAEDSGLIRSVTRLAFPPAMHQLVEAENGRQALELLDRKLEPFDAIVLDPRMPEMNGVEFVLAL